MTELPCRLFEPRDEPLVKAAETHEREKALGSAGQRPILNHIVIAASGDIPFSCDVMAHVLEPLHESGTLIKEERDPVLDKDDADAFKQIAQHVWVVAASKNIAHNVPSYCAQNLITSLCRKLGGK
jgi:hypothetical protein